MGHWDPDKTAIVKLHYAQRRDAQLEPDGTSQIRLCRYCGAAWAQRHKYHTHMCLECGKLYDRWRKATQRNIISELTLLQPRILQRYDDALSNSQAITDYIAKHGDGLYIKSVKEYKPMSKEQTSKICKQCGRDLPIEQYKKYVPRGTGKYNTTQGYHTICKECEAISARVANQLRKEKPDQKVVDKLKEHYRLLESRGLPPVTAAAQRLLYGETTRSYDKDASLDSLLASVQGETKDELTKHVRLVRDRGYASVEEAEEVHKQLEDKYGDEEAYGQAADMIEDWFMEG